MPKRLSGAWFKLVEPDGFYLGILMVPERIALSLEENRGPFNVPQRANWPSISFGMDIAPMDVSVKMMTFLPAYEPPDALMVYGISMSDLNKEPGFAFIPGAEYMQRGPVPEKKPQRRQSAVTEAAPNRLAVLDFPDE